MQLFSLRLPPGQVVSLRLLLSRLCRQPAPGLTRDGKSKDVWIVHPYRTLPPPHRACQRVNNDLVIGRAAQTVVDGRWRSRVIVQLLGAAL